jgi:hypothetical protein
MTDRSGCLSLLMGARGVRRIGVGLPRLDLSAVHASDRPALMRAWKAAEGAHTAFADPSVPDVAVADLASQLSKLLGVVYGLALGLMKARRFLERNDPDKLARERADLEMRRLGASAAEVLALRTATQALESRSRLADQVRSDLVTLGARLSSAGAELEAFRARVEARAAAEELGHELGAYLKSAELALEDYERTRLELERG